jgi:zinc/manganese transport system substrate-binding protein
VRVVRPGAAAVVLAAAMTAAAGCSLARSSAVGTSNDGPRVIYAVATINVWGSILTQLGGAHVHATSIVAHPNTDPHDYEPTPADARAIAMARLLVVNGLGYDTWGSKVAAANPDRRRAVVDVGRAVGVSAGANPHRWYSPSDVDKVADAITSALKAVDPADGSYFDARRHEFEGAGLARYHRLINDIRASYGGTAVGASENMFALLSAALGLKLVTPAKLLNAVSEGTEPSAADKATVDGQIRDNTIKVYVFNSQNSTPDVAAQVKAARARGIPVTSMTETLTPAKASFEDWQVAQLEALRAALHQATGR